MIFNINELKSHEVDLICGHLLKIQTNKISLFKPTSNFQDLSLLIDHDCISEISFDFLHKEWQPKSYNDYQFFSYNINMAVCLTFIQSHMNKLKNKTLADLFLHYKISMNDFYDNLSFHPLVRSDFSIEEKSVKDLVLIAEISDDLLNKIMQNIFNMPANFLPATKKEDALRFLNEDLVFQLASEKSKNEKVWYCATKINDSQTRSVINVRIERALTECALLHYIPFLHRHIDVSLF